MELEVPSRIPFRYRFDERLNVLAARYLAEVSSDSNLTATSHEEVVGPGAP
jgi:hypothetical protein